MNKKIKILAIQFKAKLKDKNFNLKKLAKLFKENADFKPDIVILPEVWSTGFDYDNISNDAEVIPAETTMLLSGLAENYNTNIIAGSILEKTFDNQIYNTCLVFNRDGAVVSKYRKNHTFSHFESKENEYVKSSNEICVVDIENIKFGVAICYDIRFPEQFRKMAQSGAEIFAVPAAFPQERINEWNILSQARAIENVAYLISCNQYGNSNCISPLGKIMHSSKTDDICLKYTIDTDEIVSIRKNRPFLNDIKKYD